ncbi:MAG TPA: DUF481 domain-containing protein [Opitutaceae bacterium]
MELHFRNGDQITGTFVARREGYIIFRSPLLGEITVPESEAVLVETPETPVESLAGLPPKDASLPKAVIKASGVGVKPPKPVWHGKVEFGFDQQTGRTDGTNLSVRAEADKKSGPNTYHLEGRVLYSEQYGNKTTDNDNVLFRYRHDLSPNIFAQSQTSYSKDRLAQINDDAEQNVGLGYKLIDEARNKANIGAGATAQYRQATGIESGYTYLGEIFEDYSYKLTGRLTVTQNANVGYSPEARDRLVSVNGSTVATDESATNYRIRFNTALQGKMTEHISLNLRFEYEFDNAILDPHEKVDQRVTSSIGYGF